MGPPPASDDRGSQTRPCRWTVPLWLKTLDPVDYTPAPRQRRWGPGADLKGEMRELKALLIQALQLSPAAKPCVGGQQREETPWGRGGHMRFNSPTTTRSHWIDLSRK